jgi:hypothetical protein
MSGAASLSTAQLIIRFEVIERYTRNTIASVCAGHVTNPAASVTFATSYGVGGELELLYAPQSNPILPRHQWEVDLIVEPNHRSAIGTLVERRTCYVRFYALPAKDSTTLHSQA